MDVPVGRPSDLLDQAVPVQVLVHLVEGGLDVGGPEVVELDRQVCVERPAVILELRRTTAARYRPRGPERSPRRSSSSVQGRVGEGWEPGDEAAANGGFAGVLEVEPVRSTWPSRTAWPPT